MKTVVYNNLATILGFEKTFAIFERYILMKHIFSKFRSPLSYKVALSAMLLQLGSSVANEAETIDPPAPPAEKSSSENLAVEGYTINFNNISIIEYIRFVSKILNINFVFDENDLQFNVTIVSEEPISGKNVMSALVQVLRIHGLVLLEQENNLLITPNTAVNQIPTIVSSEVAPPHPEAPIVTRVFRLKNASPQSVAAIIRPMVSRAALIEVSTETHQLIVTDVTTNVDKIAELLASLDAPHTPLEIDTYVAKNVATHDLISLATQIITPFAEGNTLLFVPHPDTNTIFIVSTPYLIERALAVMEDLDVAAPKTVVGQKPLPVAGQNILLYKPKNMSPEQLEGSLKQVASELSKNGANPKLVATIENMQWIQQSQSLLFTGDNETLAKLQELLATLDVSGIAGNPGFYLYKIQHADTNQLLNSLRQFTANLSASGTADPQLIQALESVKWISETNSLVFSGDPAALKSIADMMPLFDVVQTTVPTATEVFVYKPKHVSHEQISQELHDVALHLTPTLPSDVALSNAINSMQWVDKNQSFIFRGDAATITRLKELLMGFDIPPTQAFYLYKLQSAKGDAVLKSLDTLAENLEKSSVPDKNLIAAIRAIKWVKDNNSLLITGTPAAIEEVKTLVAQFDTGGAAPSVSAKTSFFIYKPLNRSPEALQKALSDMSEDLQTSGLMDSELLEALSSMRYVQTTNSLLFTGTPAALDKVRDLLSTLDIPESSPTPIQHLGPVTFLVYKPKYVQVEQLITSLKSFAKDLQTAGTPDTGLTVALQNMKLVKETNSILFTGPEETLQKVESLLEKFDTPSLAAQSVVAGPSTFVIYKPQYQTGPELIGILSDFEKNLIQSGVSDPGLFAAINNLKWIDKTSSLLITGDSTSINKVQELLQRFDIPGKQDYKMAPAIETIQDTNFLVYKLQYHQGSDIETALKQVAADLTRPNTNKNLFDAINSLQWIKVTNSLLTTGDAETLTKLKELISNLDIPLRQVFIEVLIVQTTLTNTQNFGLQWGGKMQFLNKAALGVDNLPTQNPNLATGGAAAPPPNFLIPNLGSISATRTPTATTDLPPLTPPGNAPTTGFDLGVIGDIIMHKGKSFISLGSLVNALQTDIDSSIVMNPKIITQDNNNSTIFVGQNIPFAGSTVTVSSAATTQTGNIEYRDVGVNLSITPILGNGDIITLEIANDISQQTINTSGNSNSLNGIQTTHTSMNTRVHVPDQHFLVLSGMITDTKTHFKSGIPCLGGLPVIGAAFSENDRVNSKDNIIIFVRPHIINSFEDYKAVTGGQETLYKEQAVLEVLKEEFDAGVDMVKTPENE